MKRIHLVCGARPNFMKVAPLYHALKQTVWAEPLLVHTQQHRSAVMSDDIWRQLSLPPPDFMLETPQREPARQLGHIVESYQSILERSKPDATVVVGDVTSTLACSIAARYNAVPLVHAEAGLRSGDVDMLEEINRVMVDSVSDLLWATTGIAKQNLINEGRPADRIEVIGNLMIDSMLAIRAATSGRLNVLQDPELTEPYVIVTLHRPSNVDNANQLNKVIAAIHELSRHIPVVWPMHPRIQSALEDHKERNAESKFRIVPAMAYAEFQSLLEGASLVITDSGGLQEETTYLGIPCLTVRRSTERPETVAMGTNELVEPANVLERALNSLAAGKKLRPAIPLWDGHAANRACESLERFFEL
jgi:UDP-N-acetylglucosamine 2-epimerase (non-hydrolysing)